MTPSQAAQEKPSPTDEERAAFKRSELDAARAIMAGDRYCPDPSVHERAAAAATPSLPMAAIRASCQWVEENVAPKRCDDEGVSDCWRCNTVFLARTLARLDEGSATPDQGKGEPR